MIGVPRKTTTEASCSRCRKRTNHTTLREITLHSSRHDDQYAAFTGEDIHWADNYAILQCRACNGVGFRHIRWSEPTDTYDVDEYPAPKPRDLPPWHDRLPPGIYGLMNEVYGAMERDARRTALMGIRAVLEMIMIEKVGDVGGFAQKADAMVDAHLLTPRNRSAVLATIDAGSAAVHRGHQPTVEDLDTALDIVETVLASLYHLPAAGERLRSSTPVRPMKKPPQK